MFLLRAKLSFLIHFLCFFLMARLLFFFFYYQLLLADRQSDRQTDRQAARQTVRQVVCKYIYIYIYLFFFDYVSHLYCISFLLFDFYNVYLVEQMKSILLLCSSVSFTFCEGKLERDRIQWEQG